MSEKRSIFVSVDGPNAVGKSALIKAIGKKLTGNGLLVHPTKEVTETELGLFIRRIHKRYRGKTLALLLAADRQDHIENEILPALKSHDIVITDRYVDSSLVFQRLDGVDESFLWSINRDFLKPNLSIAITASLGAVESRMATRKDLDRFEAEFTREAEIHAFEEAAVFMEMNGFNVFRFDNTDVTIEEGAQILSDKIMRLRQNENQRP